jgi:hypothetical protein
MPRLIWHRLFMRGAASYWQAQAASHGLSKADMLAAPDGTPARRLHHTATLQANVCS